MEEEEIEISNSQKLFTVFVNNTAIYVFVYVVLHFVYQMVTAFTAGFFGISSLVYPYKIHYFIKWYQWRMRPVLAVFSSGPFILLILGIFFLTFQYVLQRYPGKLKTVLLFAYMMSFNFFFGALISGVFVKNGFAFSLIWFSYRIGVAESVQLVLALIFALILILIGFYSRKPFLQTATSISLLEEAGIGKFVIYAMVLPWIIGSAIVTLIHAPNFNYYFIWQFGTFALIMVPIWVFYNDDDQYLIVRDPQHKISPLWLGAAVLAIAFSFLVFGNGISL